MSSSLTETPVVANGGDDGAALEPMGRPHPHKERIHFHCEADEVARRFAHYPESVRADGIWLHLYVRSKCNGEHAILAKIAGALGLKDRGGKAPSRQYWYQVAGGHYFKTGGHAETFKKFVTALRAHAATTSEHGATRFVETRNWGLVRDYIDTRRSPSSSIRMGIIEGETGSQKSWCCRHYAALDNPLETTLYNAPSRNTRSRMIHKLAERFLAYASSTLSVKEQTIEAFLKGATIINSGQDGPTRPRCVILDDAQRLFRPNVQPDQQPIFNLFHELQEETGCTVIFIVNPTFRLTLTSNHPYWRQFLGRVGGPDEILHLEQALPKADILNVARQFRVANDHQAYPLLEKWGTGLLGFRRLQFKLERARELADLEKEQEVLVGHLKSVDYDLSLPAKAMMPQLEEGAS